MEKNQYQTKQTAISIHKALASDSKRLWEVAEAIGLNHDPNYFEYNLEQQDAGKREVLIVQWENQDVGYCILNWDPKYALFRKLEIPEIQDLNVSKDMRRRGIATALIHYCETLAGERQHKQMGISAGLDSSFGAAQRLYIKLGYIPDGHGVTYDRQPVTPGEIRPVDENLCLMMVKDLVN